MVANTKRGFLTLVVDEPRPQPSPAGTGGGGRGGGGGSTTGDGDGDGGGALSDWTLFDDAVLLIGGQSRAVEVAGWRPGRLVERLGESITTPPDWLCEAAAPDRAKQLGDYVGRGVGHVWLLDQALRAIEVYRITSSSWTRVATAQGDARLRAEPFDDVILDLSSLWKSDD